MRYDTVTKTCTLDPTDDSTIEAMMENYPEAGAGLTMQCTHWIYSQLKFEFFDEETGLTHEVTRDDLRRGFKLLVEAKLRGELKGIGLNLLDPANGLDDDADTYDALVQMAVHGKVIYG